MSLSRLLVAALCITTLTTKSFAEDGPWLHFPGEKGPGQGKKIVLVSGDEEYRSEEALPQLARILAKHHGFDCTVLFAIDPKDGTVSPNINNNIPGLEKLADADLMIIFTRFRNLPDDQMEHIVNFLNAGKPVVGLRTSTHAFNIGSGKYKFLTWNNKGEDTPGGFGKAVLGETWVAHHGRHAVEGTRGILAEEQKGHPILKGIKPGSIFGTTDVYTVNLPLPGDSQPLVLGEVTTTLEPDSPPVSGRKNDPMMPVAWTKSYQLPDGKKGKAFSTTMGASEDLLYDGTRRMIINGAYWALDMADKINPNSSVDIVGEYQPSRFKFKKIEEWKPGKKPAEYAK